MSDKIIPIAPADEVPNGANQADRMRIAVELRFGRPDASWEEIASELGVHRNTLARWRDTEQYEIIHREVASRYVADLAADAYAALRRAWKRGNPAGALDVLRALALLRNSEVTINHQGMDIDREIMELIEAAKRDGQPS